MELEIKLKTLRDTYHGIDQNSLPNEDDTKRILIVDFLDCLGYNGLLIESQYPVNPRHSNRRPIDYAIKLSKSGPPVVLVECKGLGEKKPLDDFHGQCTEYFQLTQAKNNVDFILLTNGYEYRFYTDLDRDNVLDKTPILSFTLESFNCDDIKLLALFHRNQFDSAKIKSYVKDVSDKKKIKAFIQSDVIGLKQSFINYVTKEVFDTSKSDKREFVKENIPVLKLGIIVPTNENVDVGKNKLQPVKKPVTNSFKNDSINIFDIDNDDSEGKDIEYYIYEGVQSVPKSFKKMYEAVLGDLFDRFPDDLIRENPYIIPSKRKNSIEVRNGIFIRSSGNPDKVRVLKYHLARCNMTDSLKVKMRAKKLKGKPEDTSEYQWIEVSNRSSTERIKLKKREKLYGYHYKNEKVIRELHWSDMYVEVIKDLFSQEKDPNERETLGKTLDIIPFATKKRKGNYKKLFNDYELNTNNNTTIKIEKLIRALEHHRNKNSLFVRIKN